MQKGNIYKINNMVIALYHCPKCEYEAGERFAVINHILNKHWKEIESE